MLVCSYDEVKKLSGGGRVSALEVAERDMRVWRTLDRTGAVSSAALFDALGDVDKKTISNRLGYLRRWGRVEYVKEGRLWRAVPKERWPEPKSKPEDRDPVDAAIAREHLDEQRRWNERVLAEKRKREAMRGGMAARQDSRQD